MASAPVAAVRPGGLGRSIAAIGLARVGSVALDGCTYVLLARYLGPVPYGHYISLVAFVGLIDLAADMMTMDVAVREIAAEPARTNAWLTAATVLRVALACAGLIAFAAYIGLTGGASDPGSAWAAVLAAALLPMGAFRMPLAAFRAHMRMHYELAVIVAARALNLVLVLWLASLGSSVAALIGVTFASRAFLAAASWGLMLSRFGFRLQWDWSTIRHIGRESVPMGIAGLFVALQLKGDILLLGALAGQEAAGLYGVVAQLPEYLLYVPVIFSTPLLPVMSQSASRSDAPQFRQLFQHLFDTMAVLSLPIAVIGLLMPREATAALFGEAYRAAGVVVPALALSVVCTWVSHATAIATVAARLQHHFIWIQGLCVTVFLVLNLTLIPSLGVHGAAIARLTAAAAAPLLTFALLRRQIGCSLSLRPLGPLAAATAVMAMAVAFAGGQSVHAAAALGLVLYGATLWLTRFNPFAILAHKESQA